MTKARRVVCLVTTKPQGKEGDFSERKYKTRKGTTCENIMCLNCLVLDWNGISITESVTTGAAVGQGTQSREPRLLW